MTGDGSPLHEQEQLAGVGPTHKEGRRTWETLTHRFRERRCEIEAARPLRAAYPAGARMVP